MHQTQYWKLTKDTERQNLNSVTHSFPALTVCNEKGQCEVSTVCGGQVAA